MIISVIVRNLKFLISYQNTNWLIKSLKLNRLMASRNYINWESLATRPLFEDTGTIQLEYFLFSSYQINYPIRIPNMKIRARRPTLQGCSENKRKWKPLLISGAIRPNRPATWAWIDSPFPFEDVCYKRRRRLLRGFCQYPLFFPT